MDAERREVMRDIRKYGCQVIHVLEDEKNPPFSYSVGIRESSQAPELIVIGLRQEMAHFVVNEYNRRIRTGEEFATGQEYEGFLNEFPVLFEKVLKKHRDKYLRWDLWFYRGKPFDALQLIYPTTKGIWPWEKRSSKWFRGYQPLLGRKKKR
jgi:hypothetical protein